MAMGLAGGGRGRRNRRGRAPMAEINVTPLVDVMLVLLIIFMVTAPLLVAGVPVDLPETRANALSQQANQVALAINARGQVFLDDAEIAPGELAERIDGLRCAGRSATERPPITLRADRGLDYGRVMAVMGELNRAGCNSVSLVTSSPGVTNGSSREP